MLDLPLVFLGKGRRFGITQSQSIEAIICEFCCRLEQILSARKTAELSLPILIVVLSEVCCLLQVDTHVVNNK